MQIFQQLEFLLLSGILWISLVFACIGTFHLFLSHSTRKKHLSPYSGAPLLSAHEVAFDRYQKILQFLHLLPFDRIAHYDLNTAVACKYSGKLFPESFNQRRILYRLGSEWFHAAQHSAHLENSWDRWVDVFAPVQNPEELSEYKNLFEIEIPLELRTLPSQAFIYHSYWIGKDAGPFAIERSSGRLFGWVKVPDTSLQLLIPLDTFLEPSGKNIYYEQPANRKIFISRIS
jgi:hypothetical protein